MTRAAPSMKAKVGALPRTSKWAGQRMVLRGLNEVEAFIRNPDAYSPGLRPTDGVFTGANADNYKPAPAAQFREPTRNDFSENVIPLGRAAIGGRRWGKWGQISTTGREVTEFGYQPIILDQDIKYLIERDPTCKFIIEHVSQDTFREWFKFDSDILNQVFTDLQRLGIKERFMASDVSNRAFGFGLLVVGVKDGLTVDQPLGKVKAPVQQDTHPGAPVAAQEEGAVENPFTTNDGNPFQKAPAPGGQPGAQGMPKAKPKRSLDTKGVIDFIEYYGFDEILDFRFDTDPTSDTFGEVSAYHVTTTAGDYTGSEWVHASRCIPFKEDKTTKWPIGKRALDPVFDAIMLLRQAEWAMAEGFYQRVVPPFLVTAEPDFTFDKKQRDALDKQFKEFKTGVREFLGVQGVTIEPITGASQVLDVEDTFRALVSRISIGTGIPARKLILAAKGAVSESIEDRKEYEGFIASRQRSYVEANVRAFVSILVQAGVLEGVDDYEVIWPPITPQSKEEMAAIEQGLANARTVYIRERLPLPVELEYTPTEKPEMIALTAVAKPSPFGDSAGGAGGAGVKGTALPQQQVAGTPGAKTNPFTKSPDDEVDTVDDAASPHNSTNEKSFEDIDRTDPPTSEERRAQQAFEAYVNQHGRPQRGSHDAEFERLFDAFWKLKQERYWRHQPKKTPYGNEALPAGILDHSDDHVSRQLDSHEVTVAKLLHDWSNLVEASILADVAPILQDFAPEKLDSLHNPVLSGEMRSAFHETLHGIADHAARDLHDAVSTVVATVNQGVDREPIRAALSVHADTSASKYLNDALSAAKVAVASAIKNQLTPAQARLEVQNSLSSYFAKAIKNISGALSLGAFNTGRSEYLMRNKRSLRFVIFRNPLDKDTTPICKPRANEPLVVEIGSPEYVRNLSPLHYGCRSWYSPMMPGQELSLTAPERVLEVEAKAPKADGF